MRVGVPVLGVGLAASFAADRGGASAAVVGGLAIATLLAGSLLLLLGRSSHVAIVEDDAIEIRLGPRVRRVERRDADSIVILDPARTPVLQLRIGISPSQVTLPISEEQAKALAERLNLQVLGR